MIAGNCLRWARLGSWAVMDQALFATANFTLTILLARWLTPTEFGAFTIAQSAFLLFGVLHIACLAEPMLVFGTSRYASVFPGYLRQLVRAHWVLTGGGASLFGVVAVACWLRGYGSLSLAFMGAAFATPTMLLAWLARRACFACLRPHYAAAAGAGYVLLMIGAVAAVYVRGSLSPLVAFLIMGSCSVLVAAVLMRVLQRSPAGGDVPPPARELARAHWTYGRWALASSTLSWFTGNVWFFVLPVAGGLAVAGAFRALSNLVLPMYQVITALSMLLLPSLAQVRGTKTFRSILVHAVVVLVSFALVYGVLVASLGAQAIQLLYGGKFSEYARLLWPLGILPVIAGLVAVVSNALRACERPDQVFWAYAASACVALSFGVWATARWALTGAVYGQLAASSAGAALMVLLFLRHSRTVVPVTRRAPGRAAVAISAHVTGG